MTGLTERLAGKGTEQDIEYEESLMHNALAVACNTLVSIALSQRQCPMGDDCTSQYALIYCTIQAYSQPTMCLAKGTKYPGYQILWLLFSK